MISNFMSLVALSSRFPQQNLAYFPLIPPHSCQQESKLSISTIKYLSGDKGFESFFLCCGMPNSVFNCRCKCRPNSFFCRNFTYQLRAVVDRLPCLIRIQNDQNTARCRFYSNATISGPNHGLTKFTRILP